MEKGAKPPHPDQQQDVPNLETEIDPKPDGPAMISLLK
jgi:hypothetical protein